MYTLELARGHADDFERDRQRAVPALDGLRAAAARHLARNHTAPTRPRTR